MVIEGHENLKKCAYVGDNSSEEKEDFVSSEEQRNITVISQMTKVSPGIVLNGWDLPKSNNHTAAKQSNSPPSSKIGGKTKNVHLKYAEEMYLKEKKKEDHKWASQNNETINKMVDPRGELTDIANRLKSLGPHGRAVLQRFRNNETRAENDSSDIINQFHQVVQDTFAEGNRSKGGQKASKNNTDAEFRKLGSEILYHRKLTLKLDVNNETDTAQEVSLSKKWGGCFIQSRSAVLLFGSDMIKSKFCGLFKYLKAGYR